MQMDYSGFTNAANIRANAMEKLGQKIGSVIEDYAERREEKIEKDNFEAALLPFTTKMAGGDAAEAKKLTKLFSGNPKNANMIMGLMQLEQEQEEANMTQEVLNSLGRGEITAQEAAAAGVSPSDIKAQIEITEGQNVKQFTDSVTAAAEAVGGTYDPVQDAIIVDENGWKWGGKKAIPLTDPMFAKYFATGAGQNTIGLGYDVLETTNSDQGNQGQGASNTPVSASESGSSPNFMSGIGDAISSIAQTPGNLNPTNPTISTGVPIEYIEPRLDISEVSGGAVSRISDFFQRKLKENEAVRRSIYGQ